jgi:acetylornithine deacetylase/succinyl-diaminopimelate desuccinylase-like protein
MSGARAAVRTRIRGFLGREREAQTAFLAGLVRRPSDNPPGDCAAHAEHVAGELAALGFEVERDPVPAAAAQASGMVSCTNLLVRRRFADGGPVIALNAHGDAVAPGGGWSVDPYGAEIRDGTMYGRGVAVSKSDFATYAWALRALEDAQANGARLRGRVELHFTYDEEAGGELGPRRLLAGGLSRPDFAICAGFSYGVTTAHNGCLHLEIEVLGKSGHAAEPERGDDAMEASSAILGALYAYRRALGATGSSIPGIGSPTLVIGLIRGGINTNVVPDRVVFRLDRRIIPEESAAAAERTIETLVHASVRDMKGIRVSVRRVLLAQPFVRRPGQEHMVHAIGRNAREVFGVDAAPHGVPLYTDARHYSEAGIPTVLYGAGPRTLEEANGHRADERLRLADLYGATEVVALTLYDLLESPA